MKSWKTTLGGSISALGLALVVIDPTWTKIGLVISALGQFFSGMFGRDNNVSSEQAHADTTPVKMKEWT